MSKEFTIGALAKAGGVPTSTLRYYERAGLLRPSARTASNYRMYTQADLEKLRFIRAAQATGFTLDDVSQLLRPAPCAKVQHVIEERLELVTERMKELRHVQKVLRGSLKACRAHEVSGRCKVVDRLIAGSKPL